MFRVHVYNVHKMCVWVRARKATTCASRHTTAAECKLHSVIAMRKESRARAVPIFGTEYASARGDPRVARWPVIKSRFVSDTAALRVTLVKRAAATHLMTLCAYLEGAKRTAERPVVPDRTHMTAARLYGSIVRQSLFDNRVFIILGRGVRWCEHHYIRMGVCMA